MQQQNKVESLSFLIRSKIVLSENNCASISNGSVVVFNTESVYLYYKNHQYREYVKSCKYLAIDGAAIAFVLRFFGVSVNRFHGPDLMSYILTNNTKSFRIIAGGMTSNRSLVSNGRADLFIELPFTDDLDEIASILHKKILELNIMKTNIILFISLGLPKQELVSFRVLTCLAQDINSKLNASLIVPIGAAADFLSGEKMRAGILWRRLGLEWLPRLIREPRMFPRVVRSVSGIFLFIANEIKCLCNRLIKFGY